MAIFKCKMCGGTLEITAGTSVIECEYCGVTQTLPKLDDDRRANMYDRANHFRRNNDYDKAMGIFEQILNEDNTDAEAYWSLVLCRYGIEYVEDPATRNRVPTVNRAQFTSIFADEDYKSALQYADGYQRSVYEAEAKAIDEIQKGILAISQKEEPFDVFICYKETDNNGRRTQDSVLANDLYHQLTQEGFKVFFSRITLEDKLGTAYEPYIFAALNSSKVMVVLGTRPEYFNAVWVKNEWSRYLALIRGGAKKILIPAYRDMDPYDLPEEFSHLQAQDMGKLGFMQDLIRGIKKLTQEEAPKTTVVKETVTVSANASIAPLLKRAFMFLEDGEWERADDFCEQVLNLDPECADAYLGKLMAGLKVRKRELLTDYEKPFDHNNNYQKALRFADEKLRADLIGYIEHINTRNLNEYLEGVYAEATAKKERAKTEADFKEAAGLFAKIPDYEDSNEMQAFCLEQAEITRKEKVYKDACDKFERNRDNKDNLLEAAIMFKSITGYKDADQKGAECDSLVAELKAEEERNAEEKRIRIETKKKKVKKIASIVIPSVVVVATILILAITVFIPNYKYNHALEILKTAQVGDYTYLGHYEQDNNLNNGSEAIEWLILDIQDGKVLVVSKYALDFKPFNTDGPASWENSTIRNWLNNEFLNTAFTVDEKALISTVTVSADINPEHDTNLSNNVQDTQDKVFLLSLNEADVYFSSIASRICSKTEYAALNDIITSQECYWWLRTKGINPSCASGVYTAGGLDSTGKDVTNNYGIRPAMWIDLSAID